MKKALLSFFLLYTLVLAFGQTPSGEEKDYSLARTGLKIQGCYLFIANEPYYEYDHIRTEKLPNGILNSDVSEEFTKFIQKARKRYPYFNGLLISKDMQEVSFIKFRDMEVSGGGFRIGDKITFNGAGNKFIYGEIMEINSYRQRVTFRYLDIYGDEKLIEEKMAHVSPLTEEQYQEKIAEQNKEIELYTYEVGQYVTWSDKKESRFGIVRLLDAKSHKATLEYLNIYDEKKTDEIPYLEISKLEKEKYDKLLADWTIEMNKYKYTVGQYATWLDKKEPMFGTITLLDSKTHKATIEYLNIYDEKKTDAVPYLEMAIIEKSKYDQLLAAWTTEMSKYKFTIGESLSWVRGKTQTTGVVVGLDAQSHQAEMKYTNEKGEEVVEKIGYLKLSKKA